MYDAHFSVAGLIVGMFVGFSGVGGAAILAPILILLLGVKPSLAIGTDLLYSVPTKLFALVLHARQKNVDWALTRSLLAGGIPGGLGGLFCYAQLRAHVEALALESALRHAIGIAVLVACGGAIATWFVRSKHGSVAAPGEPVPNRLVAAAIGAVVGFLVALTSVGSGSITLSLLALALPAFALRRLIGSEIAFAAFLVPLAAAGHASLGNASWPMALALLIGALPGVWIGSRLCALLGDGWLRPVIVGVLAFAGSRLV